MNFKSDNIVGISPQILDAISKANLGVDESYGNDIHTSKLKLKLSEIFEADVEVYLTSTGTASNCLALSSLVTPYSNIYTHINSHIYNDECSAPEFFTSGAKLIPLSGANCKINCSELNQHVKNAISSRPHSNKPGCITITQATECGTIYSVNEIKDITKIAKQYDLPVHLDGARFTNALVSIGCTPAELTWKSGIDVLSFGATKNGAMVAEALIYFNKKYAHGADYRQKRMGQLTSKMRFFSCQWLAYLEDELWLKNAASANKYAQDLARVFIKYGLQIEYLVEANEVFVRMPKKIADYLYQNKASFYEWSNEDIRGDKLYRFVTSCFTNNMEINILEDFIKRYFAL